VDKGISKSGIYIIKNVINGKIYIGSAVNVEKRLYAHRWALQKGNHCNIHLQRAWDKDGEGEFLFETFLTCDRRYLIFYEQLTIDSSMVRHGRENIYNISPHAGSSLGRNHSEATKYKIGLKSKGRWTGKHHTEETKQKIRLGNIGKNKGRKASIETRNKMSKGGKGRTFTEEHRRKIGLANIGRKKSTEEIEKLRKANIGKKHSEEAKKKIGGAFRGKPGTRLGVKNKPKL
jgi:group I intron endonuclease